jgi:RAQPRD family integrative conjugative element protein
MNYKKIKACLLLSACLFLLICSQAQADTEQENATLARMVQVLNSLTPLINQAEQEQDPNARILFQYEQLCADIQKVKSGIDQKLNPPSIQLRPVTPISGDYLTLQSKKL